jgi:transcriptional regulator with XRE-family HTH domain
MMKVRDVGNFIRDQRRSVGLSIRTAAKLAGVSNPYLSQIERGLRRPSAEILNGIAKALRISAETLYVKAGILEEHRVDVVGAIKTDPDITDGQRETLVQIYTSFRSETQRRRARRSTGRATSAASQAGGRVESAG